jgi:hypothetical protein
MPKKSGPRSNAPTGVDNRVRRPARQLPRPSAAVPVGADLSARPTSERAVEGPTATGRATPAAPTRPMSSTPRVPRPSRATSFAAINDYGYVFADLRRIALLAAAAFLVLIGLTFVVH